MSEKRKSKKAFRQTWAALEGEDSVDMIVRVQTWITRVVLVACLGVLPYGSLAFGQTVDPDHSRELDSPNKEMPIPHQIAHEEKHPSGTRGRITTATQRPTAARPGSERTLKMLDRSLRSLDNSDRKMKTDINQIRTIGRRIQNQRSLRIR